MAKIRFGTAPSKGRPLNTIRVFEIFYYWPLLQDSLLVVLDIRLLGLCVASPPDISGGLRGGRYSSFSDLSTSSPSSVTESITSSSLLSPSEGFISSSVISASFIMVGSTI